MQDQLAKLPKLVEPIIRKAGTLLLSYFGSPLTKTQKEQGFVTEADIASEQFLIKELSKIIPHAAFFAEESGKDGTNEYCWVIDPLDGTTNFAHGIGYFCISVALTYLDKPIFGMIYQPLTDELFYAVKDTGTFYNGKKVTVSQKTDLAQALVFVGFPYLKGPGFKQVLQYIKEFSSHVFAFRHMGAVALDQAYIACGKGDAIFFQELGWWDCAAGMLLLSEAGAIVTDYAGKPIDPQYRTFLAAGPLLYQKLIDMFKRSE